MLRSVSEVFRKGFLLKDTNDDGLIDFLDTRIVVPTKASAEVIVGASNLAARLGFETMALDLPLAIEDRNVSDLRLISNPIAIGRQNRFILQFVRNGAASLDTSVPGAGLICLHRESETGQVVLCITGGDDFGTMKAATFLASEPVSPAGDEESSLSALEDTLSQVLRERGIDLNWCRVQDIIIDGKPPKIVAAHVSMELKDSSELQRAEKALNALINDKEVSFQQDSEEVELHVALTSLGQTRTAMLPRFMMKKARKRPSAELKHVPRELSLSRTYGIEGILGASSVLIPDFTNTVLIPSEGTCEAIDVSARISLESTGVQIPLARIDSEYSDTKLPANPILFGSENALSKRIIQSLQISLPYLAPGQGVIQVASAALDGRDAVLIVGKDPEGLHAASQHLATRIPYLWRRGKGETELLHIEHDVRRFLSSRTGAGQVAAALYRLEKVLARLPSDVCELGITISASLTEARLDEFVKKAVLDAGIPMEPRVTCIDLGPDRGVTVIDEAIDLPWEVDEMRDILRKEAFPSITPGCSVRIEARVSESPEIRQKLKTELMDELAGKGIHPEDTKVDIICAHKQGYSWLTETVLPLIRGRDVDSITIQFALVDEAEIRWQTVSSQIRWLQELYPVDEVLAKELNILVEKVSFCRSTEKHPIYSIKAKDRHDQVIYEGSFDPKYVIRPMFSQFPDYEKVRVATGWLLVEVDGRALIDRPIETDPERFWNYYQDRILPRVHDNVMDVFEGAPRASKAPFFDKLELELQMSEPDYHIGVDEEQISTLEALHEDIYFETLSFFDLLGLFYSGERLPYPGRVIPRVHRSRPGKGTTARVKYVGRAASSPMLQVSWKNSSGLTQSLREEMLPVAVKDPRTMLVLVQTGKEEVLRLGLRVDVDSRDDKRDQFLRVASPEIVDRQFLSAERAKRMIETLGEIHQAGLYNTELSYPFLQSLELEFFSPEGRDTASLQTAGPAPDKEPLGRSQAHPRQGRRIVEWDRPISPTRCVELVKELGTFAEVTHYRAGTSYLGRDIWAMDVTAPVKAAFWSQAKASVWKPTVILSGRQHANEVSSTSHILRLVEMLVTEDKYRTLLKRVNVVAHPIMNVDGAALGCELYELTPHFMLHAAYLGALGVDAGTDQWNPDSVYPEARVRPKLWRTWLPDIFLNPHGYPSHEWVQLFAEYGGWVRSRLPGTGRGWWIPRGWFMPGFNYIEDRRFPRHKEVAFAIRDYIVEGVNRDTEVRSLNERMYARRRKYGVFDPDIYKEDLYKDVLIYAPLKGSEKNPTSPSFMARYPEITVFEATTEAPDETATGAWLDLVCRAGLEFDLAHVRFLYESRYQLARTEKQLDDGILFVVKRERPVLPP